MQKNFWAFTVNTRGQDGELACFSSHAHMDDQNGTNNCDGERNSHCYTYACFTVAQTENVSTKKEGSNHIE